MSRFHAFDAQPMPTDPAAVTTPPRTLALPLALAASLALVGALVSGGSCANDPGKRRSRPIGDAGSPLPAIPSEHHAAGPLPDPRALPAFDARSGTPIGWSALIARVAASDAVLIGEIHGHPLGGAVSVALLGDLLAGPAPGEAPPGGTVALSLEFFGRDHQPNVDDYLAGLTDEPAFRRATGRDDDPTIGAGNYPPAHREMLEASRAAGSPVIAANAPRRYVTLARKGGLDRLESLTDEQRRLIAIPGALTDGPYRDRFFDDMATMIGEHMPDVGYVAPGEGDPADAEARQRNLDRAAYSMIKGYYRSQNIWDATMAESVARALDRGLAPVVHVVGQFHTDHDGGLTQRLRALRPGAAILTISLADDTPAQITPESAATIREEDRTRADIIIYVGSPEDW